MLGRWGWKLRAGGRHGEGWEHCRLQRKGAPRLGQPLPGSGDVVWPSWGSCVDGPAGGTHGLEQVLWCGSGPSGAGQPPGRRCSALLGRIRAGLP